MAMQTRTINSIQKKLAKSFTPANREAGKNADPYLRCVFNPFTSMGRGSMRPDSGSSKIIMRDILQSFDIVTEAAIGLKLSPMYPYVLSVWNTASSNALVNGIPVPDMSTTGAGWTPLAGKAEGDYNPATQPLIDYDRARISTIGWRLMYTGRTLDAEGYILVDTCPFTVDLVDRQVPATCTYINQAGVSTNYIANSSVAYVQVETALFTNNLYNTFTPIVPTQTSQIFRPEAGAQGVLRRSAYSPNHPFKPIYNYGASPIDNRNSDPNVARCMISSSKAVQAGVSLIDDEFDSTMIYLPTQGRYRLEIIICLESIVNQQSNLEPLSKASPPLNNKVLTQESKVMAKLPVAVAVDRPLVQDRQLIPEPEPAEKLLRLVERAGERLGARAPPPQNNTLRTTTKGTTAKGKVK